MTTRNHRILSVAAVLLLTVSAATAQTAITRPPVTAAEQAGIDKLNGQDPATLTATVQENELPWTPILAADIKWRKRVWRSIDAQDARNTAFSAAAKTNLATILVQGVVNDKVKAYRNDIGFLPVISKEDLLAMLVPGKGSNGIDLKQVIKYNIKEDWLYVAKDNKIVVRVVGIAPVREVKGADGKVTEEAICWFYYPECREYLAQQKAMTADADMSWNDIMQNRKFASTITKVATSSATAKQN